jgi:Mrp family chromosome partitioning ATPase
LTNGRFKKLIEEARLEYDYVVVDTAPTILVTDTMLISSLADATLYIVRSNFTEKSLLSYSKELFESGKLKNMAYVINSVGSSKSYGYSYNYGYNYGYGGQA